MDDGFIVIPRGAFVEEYWIHPTREVGWIRTKAKKTGGWAYRGEATLYGADGKARVSRVNIEGRRYYRHRLTALATDGGADALDKFRGGRMHPVLHYERREEDARPNDADVKFGTPKENRNDPNNKKRKPYASGHPVLLTSDTTKEPLKFESVKAAAAFLGANRGGLSRYLSRKKTSKRRMPVCEREGIWEAIYDEFDLKDAVRVVRAAAELYLSPSHPNRLFRKLQTGKFATTGIERSDTGYVPVCVGDGKSVLLHRLVVETLLPGAFADKLAKNPGLVKTDLHVDHVDGDKGNNAIDNLEVLTVVEHARKHAHAVEWLNERMKPIWRFECAVDVADTISGKDGRRLHDSAVQRVCDGDLKHTGGRFFRWAYKEGMEAKRAGKKRKRTY